ncbi:hypothetical protein [Mucisphaera sp.]|uniref:GspE/PulE/PilB domain-containing protein n=1 Tax=Mucisphaera sp. TaxID=2913024 RepID=UPI003D0B9CD3
MSFEQDSSIPPRRGVRIGEILVERGVLSEHQVFEITQAQKKQHLPFGVLAERMFDVTLDSVESAWIEQYHRFSGTLDLNEVEIDTEALKLINRRQAWQFEILPIRFEPDGQLLMAASRSRLARAVTFAARRIDRDVYTRIAESKQLQLFLRQYFPMPEVSGELVDQAKRLAG